MEKVDLFTVKLNEKVTHAKQSKGILSQIHMGHWSVELLATRCLSFQQDFSFLSGRANETMKS